MISLRRSDLAFIWGVASFIVFGVVLNPFVDTWWNAHQVILCIVAVAVLAAPRSKSSVRSAGSMGRVVR